MNGCKTLFDLPPIAATRDPESSQEAAAFVIDSGLKGKQCRIVLAALRRNEGTTSRELASISRLDRYMTARRLPTLREMQLVQNCREGRCQLCVPVEIKGNVPCECDKADYRKCDISHKKCMTWWSVRR